MVKVMNSQVVPKGYKQTKVGVIPEDWDVVKLGEILTIGSGKDYKHLKNGDIPVYGTGGYMLSVNKFLFDGESLCIGRKGTIDKPMLLNGKFWTVDTLFYTHSYINSIPKFLYSSFLRINWKKYNEASGVPSLSKSTIETITIPLPPINEQEKIANILITWDDAISKQTELIKAKEELKKGLMQKLLSGVVRFDEFNDEWKRKDLGDLVEFYNGKAHEKNIVRNGKYIVINSKFISTNGNIKKYTNNLNLSASIGNIVMVMSDVPNGKAIAKCFYIDKESTYTINQRICLLKPIKINSLFLFYILNRNKYYLCFDDGAKQTNLRKEDVLNCPLIIPLLQEQQKIEEVLSNADKEIDLLKNEIKELKEQKKGLMQKLLIGKVRVMV